MILVIAVVSVFSFVTAAFATDSIAKEYVHEQDETFVDADTACKLYSELYAKYFTVTVDKAEYKPVTAKTLKRELLDLEKQLKYATSLVNNIQVVYDKEGY